MKDFYLKIVVRCFLIILLSIILLKVSSGYFSIVFFPVLLVLVSQRRTEYLVFLLLLMFSLAVSSHVLVPKPIVFQVTLRISYFTIAAILIFQNAGRRLSRLVSPMLILLFYVFYMAIVSLLGWQPVISELKILLFLVVFLALMFASNSATGSNVDEKILRSMILSCVCYFVFGSIITIAMPSIGRSMVAAQMAFYSEGVVDLVALATSESLFSGVTWHPQTLGPLVAILNAFLAMDYFVGVRGKSWLYRGLLIAIPVLVYMSSSRTAMGAFIISWLVVFYFVLKTRGVASVYKERILTGCFLLLFLGVVCIFVLPQVRLKILSFVVKAGNEVSLESEMVSTERLLSTRQGLIDLGMYNFRKSPLIGNGFQVSNIMEEMKIKKVSMLLSAPIEKGVLPVMVLEEGGIFGAIIMLVFIGSVCVTFFRCQAFVGLACFSVVFVTNFGEAYFFSMSGFGGLAWTFVFLGIAMDAQRNRRRFYFNGNESFTS